MTAASQAPGWDPAFQGWLPDEPFEPYRNQVRRDGVNPFTSAELVAEAIFEHWISPWRTMRALLTNNGRQFTARLLQQLTDIYGIKHIYSSPYNPRGNSAVESCMRTLKTTLKLCT